jgi:hypothetical protein
LDYFYIEASAIQGKGSKVTDNQMKKAIELKALDFGSGSEHSGVSAMIRAEFKLDEGAIRDKLVTHRKPVWDVNICNVILYYLVPCYKN